MIKYILILILSLISYSSIEIQETKESIIINVKDLIFNGQFYNSAFSSYSEISGRSNELTFRLALDTSLIKDVLIDSENVTYKINEIGEVNKLNHLDLKIIPKVGILPSDFKIEVYLTENIGLSDKTVSDPLFNLTVNNKQLAHQYYYQNIKSTKYNSEKQNERLSWIDPSKTYAKINIDKDGISKIATADLVEILGEGMKIDEISVYNKGNLYPNFYIKSDDDILTSNDEFYLLVGRQRGDSTNFDFYTNTSSYYVTTGNQEQKLAEVQNQNTSEVLSHINQEFTVEEESIYRNGLVGIDYQTNAWEGWYEKSTVVISAKDGVYQNNFYLPFDDNSDAQIQAYYSHNVFPESIVSNNSNFNNKYNLDFFINGLFDFNTGTYNLLDYDEEYFWAGEHLIERNFVSGLNNFKLITKFTDSTERADILFDRLEVNALVPPIAFNDKISFSTNNENNVLINIDNFNSEEIIAIDTLNHVIQFPNSKNRISVSGSVNSFWTSLRIGNEIYTSETEGIHFIALNGEIGSDNFNSGTISENSVDEFIDDLNNYEVFAIAINSKPEDSVIQKFLEIGFDVVDNCVFVSDGNLNFQDNKQSNAIVNSTFDKTLGNYSIELNSNPNSNWIVSSSESFIDYEIEILNIDEDIRNFEENTDVILIYHDNFIKYANEYKTYREQKGFKIKNVNVESIYDEFNYGRKSPHSIKKYLEYVYENINDYPKHVYFVGDASKDPFKRLSGSVADDYIPSYGFPVSDNWFAEIDKENGNRFKFIITRLPLHDVEDGDHFLEKVKSYDEQAKSPWMKEFLVLTGGRPTDYLSLFDRSRDMFENLTDVEFCIDTTLITKFLDGEPGELASRIQNELNNGKIWTNFIGHGSVNSVDLGGWNSYNLNNKNRLGIVSTVSCNTGEFANPQIQKSRNEDLIFSKDRGFVGAFGGSTTGYEDLSSIKMQIMMNFVRDQNFALRRPSEILFAAIEQRDIDENIKMTYNYLGDPLLELPISKREDYFIINNSFEVNSSEDSFISVGEETVNIEFDVFNLGYNLTNPRVRVIRDVGSFKDTFNIDINSNCGVNTVSLDLPILNRPGTHELTIEIDPDKISLETDRSDNVSYESFEVFAGNLILIDPQNNWNLDPENPKLRFMNLNNNEPENFTINLFDSNSNLIDTKNISSTLSKIDIDLSDIENIDQLAYFDYGNELYSNQINVNINKIDIPNVKHIIKAEDLITINGLTLSSNKLELGRKSIDFKVESFQNNNNQQPSSVFYLNDEIIDNEGFIGYTIIEINKQNGIYNINRYNTRGDLTQSPPTFDKTDTRELINYLQNNIDTAENYYLISSSGEANYIPLNICSDDNTCSADVLLQEFVNLGSELYTLTGLTLNQTFVMSLGNSTNESLDFSDSTSLKGEFILNNTYGKLQTDRIQHVKNWNALKVLGNLDNTSILLKSISSNDSTEFESINGEFNLSAINSDNAYFEISLESDDSNKYIESVEIIYEPVPELVLSAEKDQDIVLRGDSVLIEFNVENYSLRADTDILEAVSFDGDDLISSSTFSSISKDSEKLLNLKNNSINFRSETELILEIDQNLKEINLKDNSTRISTGVFEDTIPPTIKVYIDSVLVESYDYVSINPDIIIDVYDNSRLPFSGIDNLNLIRINGPFSKDSVIVNTEFNFDQTGGLKARYKINNMNKFIIGENQSNFLDLAIEDASSNEAKLFHYYNIAGVGRIENVLNFPNPFSDVTTIRFEVQSHNIINDSKSIINIYNSNGYLIRTIETKLKAGKNEVIWDGLSNNGNTNSSGVYFYIILVESIDSETGKMFKRN